ncbi:hypothetical protein Daus18300_012360 [Diaporthe australafricana]|uniref:Ubiquitin-like domain-containing protein n=1 Tax=Diaporthe australafricana TaxID=127596 RepID=A0ABR3W3C7_9PEZI
MSRERISTITIPASRESITDGEDESQYTDQSDSQADEEDWSHDDDIDPSDSASATADYRAQPPRPHSRGAARNPTRQHSIPRQPQRYPYRAAVPTAPPPQADHMQTMSSDASEDYMYSAGRGHFAPPQHQGYYGGRGGYPQPQSLASGFAPPPHHGYGGQMVPFGSNPFSPMSQGGGAGYFPEQRPYDMMPYAHQQPGYFGGAGPVAAPNYGMPHHVAQYMYPSPPPPPTEAPAPPRTPAPAEEKPNPEMELMKRQLALLQAERKEQEESSKRAELEKKIREDAEHAFKIRMEEMHRAQEEAKKEIELAKIAAERAARERIEEERKAEAERQRMHAEMMAKAERDARDRIEKERKEEAERQRQHAEAMAKAEREAKEKYEAALKAEEERKAQQEEERKRAEENARLKLEAEIKAAEEAKKLAEKQAAEEAERKKLFEEETRVRAEKELRDKIAADKKAEEEKKSAEEAAKLKYENEARLKLEKERLDAEDAKQKEEAAKKEREELLKKYEEEAKVKAAEEAKKAAGDDKEPIKFKDAVGRKFNFPWNLCATWSSMEDLIKQAFAHVEVIGPHVQEGHYDLMGPDGEIILPVVWEKTVQPGWQINMRMWPAEKHPLRGPPQPDPRMSPEQHMRWQQLQRLRAAAAAQGGGRPHGHHGHAQPMRPPAGFTGGMPMGGMPPPPPGGRMYPPPGGEGGRPAMVDIVEGGKPDKKGSKKKAKRTLGFFSGAKPSKKGSSSKKWVYTDHTGYS